MFSVMGCEPDKSGFNMVAFQAINLRNTNENDIFSFFVIKHESELCLSLILQL